MSCYKGFTIVLDPWAWIIGSYSLASTIEKMGYNMFDSSYKYSTFYFPLLSLKKHPNLSDFYIFVSDASISILILSLYKTLLLNITFLFLIIFLF